jgi:hypothetical protein
VRNANIAIYCEVIEWDESLDPTHRIGHRKMIFPLDVATREGVRVSSKELASTICGAAQLLGISPEEVVLAMVTQMRAESEKLCSLVSSSMLGGL